MRFARSGNLDDLETAIRLSEEAISVTPTDHPLRTTILDRLGCYLCARFGLLGAVDDLDNAIKAATEAVNSASSDHPDRPLMWNRLSNHLTLKFMHLNDADALEQAIEASEISIKTTLAGHPNRASRLLSHATLLHIRYTQTHSSTDSDDSVCYALMAWLSPVSWPTTRIQAACFAARHLVSIAKWKGASSLLTDALKLLPQTSPQFLDRSDQEYILSGFSELAAVACSTALQAGSTASDCLSLLELGRGIIIGLAINRRNDLSELEARDHELFQKLNSLRIEIDSRSVEINIPNELRQSIDMDECRRRDEDRRRRRVKVIADHEETLAYIRRLPGFERFQLPLLAQELIAMGAEGPIVIFNSAPIRSDAIIVTSSAVKSLALPKLVYSEVRHQLGNLAGLARGKRSTYPERNRVMGQVLLWLWEVAVEPVLGELLLGAVDDDTKLPRVWWIGVGPLAMAPFHAAGDHSLGSTRNTISRVISSYIPTIKTLSYARQKQLELHRSPDPRILLVTMPTTPDTPSTPSVPANPGTPGTPNIFSTRATSSSPAKKWTPLPHVTKEVEDIMNAVQERSSALMTRLDPHAQPKSSRNFQDTT